MPVLVVTDFRNLGSCFEDIENAKNSYRLTLATMSNGYKERSIVKTPTYNFALILIRLVVLGSPS